MYGGGAFTIAQDLGIELQEGEENTVVTNIFVDKSVNDITFKANSENADGLNYLDGKSIKSMLQHLI